MEVCIDSNKFLTFCLSEKNYGFPILNVSEVIVMPHITPIPKTPAYMEGVINLRGKIIPLIDLSKALNMPACQYGKETCVIIVKMGNENAPKPMGFIVDCVSEVFEISNENIETPPSYGDIASNDDFLLGIGKIKEKIIMLLDINKILSDSESTDFLKDDFSTVLT